MGEDILKDEYREIIKIGMTGSGRGAPTVRCLWRASRQSTQFLLLLAVGVGLSAQALTFL